MLVFIFSVRCSTLAWKHRVSHIKPARATLTLQSLIAEWRAAGNIYTTMGRHILSFTQLVSPRGLMQQKCRFTTPHTCAFYCFSLWSLKKCLFYYLFMHFYGWNSLWHVLVIVHMQRQTSKKLNCALRPDFLKRKLVWQNLQSIKNSTLLD